MRYKKLKGKAWKQVKVYVRRKEKDCYTCPAKNLKGFNAQAGHFIPVALSGSNNTLSWDPIQIHLQCGHCNGAGQGMQVAYRERLVRDYGAGAVLSLEARQRKIDPIKDWQAVIDYYKAL